MAEETTDVDSWPMATTGNWWLSDIRPAGFLEKYVCMYMYNLTAEEWSAEESPFRIWTFCWGKLMLTFLGGKSAGTYHKSDIAPIFA